MKHFFQTVVFVLSFFSVFHASAQSVSQKDARRFNIAVLGVLDEYERTVSFSEKKDRPAFLRLFADSSKPCIYNDLISSEGFQQTISPEQYVANVPEDGSLLIRSVISDIRKEGGITDQDGRLCRKISFSKYIMEIDTSVYTEGEGGVLFDSSQAFGEEPDYRLVMELSYDPVSGRCAITEIAPIGKKTATPLDESRFSIVTQSSEKYDKQLTSGGKPLVFNDFNQSVAYYNDVDIDNPDIYVEPIEYAAGGRYNVLGLKFKSMYFRCKAYGNLTLGNAFDISASNSGIVSKSRNIQCGADIGFEFSLNRIWRAGLYSGIGLSQGRIDLSIENVKYELSYVRPVKKYDFSASEDLELTDFLVPVYLENEFSLGKKFVLDIDLGARFYLNRKTNLGLYRVHGEIGNMTIDTFFSQFINPVDYTRSEYDIALFANAELDYCLVKHLLYAYLSYGYEQGIKSSYNSGMHKYFSPKENVYPFYYSPLADRDYPYRSLIGSVSYQRKAGWLSLGVKIKF